MDETYMGGVRRGVKGKPAAGGKKKTSVVGIVERQGRLRALVAKDTTGSTLLGMVKEHILPNTTVFTDEYRPYDGIDTCRMGINTSASSTARKSTWLGTFTRTR